GHNATDDLMTEVKATDCTPLPPLENLISYPYNIDVQRRKMEHELAPVWSKFVNLALCIINPIRSEDGGIIQNRINQVAINYLTRKDDHWSNYTSNRKTAFHTSSRAPSANTVTHTTQTSGRCLSYEWDCSFYSRCLEKSIPCGKDGYATGFGDKYCTKFVKNLSKFSPMGQTWMFRTMSCLQRTLEPIANGEVSMNCSQIAEFAYTSHPDCYAVSTPGGVCLLPFTDWVELVGSIEINVLVVKQMVITTIFCGKVYYGKIMATMKTVYASLNSKLI
ncbi:hypothetical protein Fcan01_25059, partial [Folsomia candida]